MKPSTAGSMIGVLLVSGFVITSSLLVLAPVLSTGVLPEGATEAFKMYFNTVGGVVGVIVGYYFGRQAANSGESKDNRRPAPPPAAE